MRRVLAVLLWLAYALRLRAIANRLQQWLTERNAPTSQLPRFDTPERMLAYLDGKDDLYEVDSYRAAIDGVALRYGWGKVVGWVFETVDLKRVAIWPRVP